MIDKKDCNVLVLNKWQTEGKNIGVNYFIVKVHFTVKEMFLILTSQKANAVKNKIKLQSLAIFKESALLTEMFYV